MPDLRPDTSIFTKPSAPMGVGDLMGMMNQMQTYQGQQNMSQALQGAHNPETGEIDYDKATASWAAGPGWKSPQQAQALTAASVAQAEQNRYRGEQIAKIWGPLIDHPGKPGPDEINRAVLQTQDMLGNGPKAAKILHDLFGDPTKLSQAELIRRVTNLRQTYGSLPGFKSISTTSGDVMVPEAQYAEEVARGQGGQAPPAPVTGKDGKVTPEHMTASDAAFGQGILSSDPNAVQPYRQAQQQSANYQDDTVGLETAIKEIKKHDTPTGVLAPISVEFKKVLHSLGAIGDEEMKGVISYEKSKKYLQDFINKQGISAQSVDHLLAATSATPNMTMEKASILDVAETALALRRMRQVGFEEFNRLRDQRTGRSAQPGGFAQWFATWAPRQDVRAFAADMYGKDHVKMLDDELSKDKEADSRFAASHAAGQRSRIYRPPAYWSEGR